MQVSFLCSRIKLPVQNLLKKIIALINLLLACVLTTPASLPSCWIHLVPRVPRSFAGFTESLQCRRRRYQAIDRQRCRPSQPTAWAPLLPPTRVPARASPSFRAFPIPPTKARSTAPIWWTRSEEAYPTLTGTNSLGKEGLLSSTGLKIVLRQNALSSEMTL